MRSFSLLNSQAITTFFVCILGVSSLNAQGNFVPDENYSAGREVMKAIFQSIQKHRFNVQINFSASVDPRLDTPSAIDVFDLEATMAFKHAPQGLKVPLQAPDKKLNQDEAKLQTFFSTNLNDIFAVLRIRRTQIENEFEGDFLFYTNKGGQGKVVPTSVDVMISNELIEMKKLFLYGVRMKLALPNSQTKKEDIKKGLLSALIECRADTESIDVFDYKKTQVPVQKCVFSFDGQRYRVEYKEAQFKY